MSVSTESKSKNIEEMFKAGMHFGYSRSSRHPNNKDFIFGIRNNIEIFDLEKVSRKLDEAKDFVKNLGKDKKTILFVGTKIEARQIIKEASEELNMSYVIERWIGGTLTNAKVIKGRIEYLDEISKKKQSGELIAKYTKKECMLIERDLSKLEKYFGGLKNNNNPDAMIIIDPCYENIASAEAKKKSIPVIALINSDCDPKSVSYPVPGNDVSASSIKYFIDEVVKSYKEGLALSEKVETVEKKIPNS